MGKKIIKINVPAKGECRIDVKPKNKVSFLKKVNSLIIFLILICIIAIIGFFFQFPAMLFISYFSFAVAVTAMLKDHIVLNSLATPIAFTNTAVLVIDFATGNIAWLIHLPTSIMTIFIANARDRYDIRLMTLFSLAISFWYYSIFLSLLPFTYYELGWVICEFFLCEPMIFMLGLLSGATITSVITWWFRSECK